MFLQKITKQRVLIFISIIALAVLIWPNFTTAAEILPSCASSGNCTLCEILQTGLNIFKIALGLLGAAALLMFIWHGITILTSAGSPEKVKSGFKGMGNTLFGILLILGSWLIVNTIIAIATGNPAAKIFGNANWYVCGASVTTPQVQQ